MAPVGLALGSLLPTALVAGAVGAPIASSVMAMTADKPQTPQTPQMPELPKVEDAAKQAKARQTQKRADIARSKSVFTNPLGITEQANTARRSLLGV